MKDYSEYYANKRDKILQELKPLLKDFAGINDYDYVIDYEVGGIYAKEILVIEGQKIGCSSNSISAVVEEAFGYLIVKYYARVRGLGAFKIQTLNYIKQYWIKE